MVIFWGENYVGVNGFMNLFSRGYFKFELKMGMGIMKKFGNVESNISSVVEFQRWWVLKSKIFGQESTYSKDFFSN